MTTSPTKPKPVIRANNVAVPPTVKTANYIERHELSLLDLLAAKYPERAIEKGKKSLLTSPIS